MSSGIQRELYVNVDVALFRISKIPPPFPPEAVSYKDFQRGLLANHTTDASGTITLKNMGFTAPSYYCRENCDAIKHKLLKTAALSWFLFFLSILKPYFSIYEWSVLQRETYCVY